MKQNFYLTCLFLFAVSVLGCKGGGIDTQYVGGVLTLDGQPLDGANITFHPVAEGGLIAAGISDANGGYTVTSLYGEGGRGAMPGEYVVTVTKSKIVKLAKPIKHDDGTETTETSEPMLAPVYRDKTKTPFRFEVKQGKNAFNIDLSSKP